MAGQKLVCEREDYPFGRWGLLAAGTNQRIVSSRHVSPAAQLP